MEQDGGLNMSDQDEVDVHSTIPTIDANGPTRQRHAFWQAMFDLKAWWLAVALSSEVIALSFNAFFPTLTQTLNFGTTVTLILVAPPWFVAAIGAFFVAR